MDTRVTDSLIGALVDGRYRIRARVARGGMATVYTATDERLERTVALKIIHPAQTRDPQFMARFTDEAKTIARLTHPNVVAVYDQGSFEGAPYLVMEYVRGHTLRELLAERRRLGVIESLAVLEQILAAVAAAHRAGMVHRDIKPENVLVAEAPGSGNLVDSVVKVADFGLARAVEEASAEEGGQLMATVAYVAPELVTEGRADTRTDIYSAGIVLFEMLTGRVPYDGDRPVDIAWQHVDQQVPPPSKFVAGLPRAVDELVAKATDRDPGRRPSDAGAFLSEVQVVREELGVVAAGARVAAQPTIRVNSIDPPTQALASSARPAWARLPEPAVGRESGTRRADRRPAPTNALAVWYGRITSTPRGRQGVAAAIVVLGLLVALGGWWVGVGRYTQAPALTSLTKQQATSVAGQHGFKLKYATPRYREDVPKDTVIGQQPGGGQRIVKGGTITLTLSLGAERYELPDENGNTFEQAYADLITLKVVITRADVYSDTIPAGHVISTNPAAGATVAPGETVTVNVSKGKSPHPMPDLGGKEGNAAKAQLDAMKIGLQVGFTYADSDKPANSVIAQDPAPGAGLEQGQKVILTLSKGPALVAVPNVANAGMTCAQAAQTLQQVGLGVNINGAQGGNFVFNQNPGAGQQVPPGTQVTIWCV
jgi:eukaryotic-like serine/threonine-protein kinase